MNADTIKAIQDAVNPIAQKLGEGTEALWHIYIKQMLAEGIVWYIIALLCIPVAVAAVIGMQKAIARGVKLNEADKYHLDGDGWVVGGWIVGIFVVVLSFAFFFGGVVQGTLDLVNPEYQAIQRVVDQVKNNK